MKAGFVLSFGAPVAAALLLVALGVQVGCQRLDGRRLPVAPRPGPRGVPVAAPPHGPVHG
ncbi:hypothetical protein ACSMX9_12525 [Streptomyces sp. LE64]|uniref:hypothetical protein n=1 Tax=Streptomyces sp. LE64 TaxID=3448653 RepID=UPI0040435ED6